MFVAMWYGLCHIHYGQWWDVNDRKVRWSQDIGAVYVSTAHTESYEMGEGLYKTKNIFVL